MAWIAVADSDPAAAQPRTVPVPPSQRDRTIPSPITDRFHLRGTYFSATAATDVRLDPTAATPGTELDAEGELGLDGEIDQGRIELMFRLRERNRIRMDFFKLDRYGEAILSRQVIFGDETFDVNDRVVTTLDLRMLTFTYTYSFLRRERFELGGGLGIHLMETEARGEVPADFQREEEAQGGALPSVALDLAWRISRRFAVAARGQYFTASVDEFDGSMSDYHVDVQYRLRPNLAVGLGYSSISLELDVTDQDTPGRFDLATRGPELFFRVSF
ncbi:MAG: hypothetical protein ACRETX_03225 [Steroidobacteraceae bacterium]